MNAKYWAITKATSTTKQSKVVQSKNVQFLINVLHVCLICMYVLAGIVWLMDAFQRQLHISQEMLLIKLINVCMFFFFNYVDI